MQQFAVPARYQPPPDANLADDVFEHAERWPDHAAYSRKVAGAWRPVTSAELADQVRRLAAGLMSAGVQPGDRVGLMSRTRYEWMLSDYAIWTAGAVTVPVYETSSAEQVEWILGDSGAVAVIAETEQHAATVTQVRDRLPVLRQLWGIDAGALQELTTAGRGIPDADVESRRRGLAADAVATIIYTSGTTGRPKGCALTHANLLAEVHNVTRGDGLPEVWNENASTLLFLPLAHVLARIIQLAAVRARVHLGHTPDIKNVAAELAEFRPTVVLSVPRVFEKIYNTAKHKAAAEGRRRIFTAAEAAAVAYSEAVETGRVGTRTRLRHAVFDRLVYRRLRAAMGGRVRFAFSGGAPLGARLTHFFRGVGVSVLEGYGLTETCGPATLNLPAAGRVGSVGRPIPGCAVRIAHDGEVSLQGGHVFVGYWQNEAATKEVLDPDGWFATGDLGQLDQDGFLEITGRKKDLIVTSAGKNVAPAVLEDRLRAHRLVSQCLVVGEARPFVGALVTIDTEVFGQWRQERGKPEHATVADLREDPELVAAVREAVDEANRAVSQAEAIRAFRILGEDFTEQGGQLTPTLKVRRNVVLQQFADEVESLYGGARRS